LREVATLLYRWRDNHLARVGVPTTLQVDWDYLKAITCCWSSCVVSIFDPSLTPSAGVSDANYHVMWIIANLAVLDFDVNDPPSAAAQPPGSAVNGEARRLIEELKGEFAYEALHAATRIAALVSCTPALSRATD
jgi:hypothetical protein